VERQRQLKENLQKLARIRALDAEIASLHEKAKDFDKQSSEAETNRGTVARWLDLKPSGWLLLRMQADACRREIDDKVKEKANISCTNTDAESFSKQLIADEANEIETLKYHKAVKLASREKKQREEANLMKLKAAAASAMGKTRDHANTIRSQIKKSEHCPYCGDILQTADCHLDHIYPVAKGGHSTPTNMVFVCARCNMKKKDMTLNQFIDLYKMNRNRVWEQLQALGKDY
jgi:5-methylcytosine-specific restriction endonuclease McrA